MSTNSIIIDIAPQAINIDFRTVKTRDINFGYDAFDGDGVTTEFVLSAQFKSSALVVFVNGVLAKKGAGAAYTEGANRDRIIFSAAPAGGSFKDEIVAFYAKA